MSEAVVEAAVKVLSKQDKTRALKFLQQMQPEVKQAALAALQVHIHPILLFAFCHPRPA